MGRSIQRQFLRDFKKQSRSSGPKEKCDFDIDVVGGLKHKFPEETLAVFVKPPSVE
jgi:hypothetical protein